jgi:hypothetical protein
MRRTLLLLSSMMLLAGCTLPAPASPEGPTAVSIFPTPTTEGSAPETPLVPSTATLTPPPSATVSVEPTATVAATATETPSPTVTPPPAGTRLEPTAIYGRPTWTDPMDADSLENWSTGGVLPDTENIRLTLTDGFLTVTGKKLEFDTWWFTWPEISNFILEMTVRVGNCSGLDSYGVIFRGPPRGVTPAHGYIAVFSCDGRFQLRRVDTTNPYTFVDLIGWTPNTAIRSGPNQTNVLGIRADGGTLTLYANGFRLGEVTDNRFTQGRYGVFVRSGEDAAFTYSVDQIAHWILED